MPANVIIKFFSAELGCKETGAILTGTHELQKLEALLDKFIKKYVVCKGCKDPELAYVIVKKELMASCQACTLPQYKLDKEHKAGKQLFKDVPSMPQRSYKSKKPPRSDSSPKKKVPRQ